MTNNDQFKKDATELLEKIIEFKRDYIPVSRNSNSPIESFERELRLMLRVARTDIENEAQDQKDSWC